MAALCDKDGCNCLGTKFCGGCGDVSYCSADCQKEDWIQHKLSCVNIDKLPTKLLSGHNICKIVEKVYAKKTIFETQGNVREGIVLLEKLLVFEKEQFGEEILGTQDSLRRNGEIIANTMMLHTRSRLGHLYLSLNDIDTGLEIALENRRQHDLKDTSNNSTILGIADTELVLAKCYIQHDNFTQAEYHCEQGLIFAQRIVGEYRLESEHQALQGFAHLRIRQERFAEAIELSERAYILVSEVYGCVHFEVQQAGNTLVHNLLRCDDYIRADKYCCMNYENIKDPANGLEQGGELESMAMQQLATIWCHSDRDDEEKAEEAEQMIKGAVTIIEKKFGFESHVLSDYLMIYVDVLLARNKYTEETRVIIYRSAFIARKYSTLDQRAVVRCVARCYGYHLHMYEHLPPGKEKNSELKLQNQFIRELEYLKDEIFAPGRKIKWKTWAADI